MRASPSVVRDALRKTQIGVELSSRGERWLARHRSAVVGSVALPGSFLYDRVQGFRNWFHRNFAATPHRHEERVRHVQEQVREWNESGRARPMCTARPGWHTISPRRGSYKKDYHPIEVNLRDVLEVDVDRRVVRVEPLADMGQISRHLLPKGWALAVMVEMEDLTAGGLVMGVGMEVSSHKYGLMHETVTAYEVILADGSRVWATPTDNADLYHALPWSHGTLGFVVSLELRIVPVKPYVHIRYHPCKTQKELCDTFRKLASAEDAPEFIEATVYSRNSGVVMAGDFADADTPDDKAKINDIGRWYKPYFYQHVRRFLERGPGEEHIPLRQYYHRHTRGLFWEFENLIPAAGHPLFRWTLGWLGAPKVALLKLTMTSSIRQRLRYQHVAQDIMIPIREMERAIDLFDELFEVYPLLVYPMRIHDHGEHQSFVHRPRHPEPGKSYEMYFDLGAYGIPGPIRRGQPWDARRAVRMMEQFTRSVRGYQLPYVDTFQTRDEFEQMFDHGFYRRMRAKYGATDAFPEVWDKVRPQD